MRWYHGGGVGVGVGGDGGGGDGCGVCGGCGECGVGAVGAVWYLFEPVEEEHDDLTLCQEDLWIVEVHLVTLDLPGGTLRTIVGDRGTPVPALAATVATLPLLLLLLPAPATLLAAPEDADGRLLNGAQVRQRHRLLLVGGLAWGVLLRNWIVEQLAEDWRVVSIVRKSLEKKYIIIV